MAYGGLLLFFAGKRKLWFSFQIAEGALWLGWGTVFNIYFTPSSHGGLFYSLLHDGEVSVNCGPDQQHIFQAVLYMFVGMMALVCARLRYRTGFVRHAPALP